MDADPGSDEDLDDDDPAVYLDEVSSDVAVDPDDVDMLDDEDDEEYVFINLHSFAADFTLQ